jgi:hypothetical protein
VVIYFVLLLNLVCLLDYSPDHMVCPPEIPPLTLLSGEHAVVVLPHILTKEFAALMLF